MKPKINTYSKFQMSYNLFQFSCPKRLLWGKEKSRDDCCYYARFHILTCSCQIRYRFRAKCMHLFNDVAA